MKIWINQGLFQQYCVAFYNQLNDAHCGQPNFEALLAFPDNHKKTPLA
jgi:hypothetical protein